MMESLGEYFRVLFLEKKMIAQIECTESFLQLEDELVVDEEIWKEFLASKQVVYGLQHEKIKMLAENPTKIEYPVIVGKGQLPVDGTDGNVEYYINYSHEIQRDKDWDFREVMRIPSVEKGQKIGKLLKPTEGKAGRDVTDVSIPPLSGKPALARAGKNIIFREEDYSFYAIENGQFTLVDNKLNVYPEYEVNETLSLKDGNLDFVGTIIIRGDVPAGFTVKAEGDVKIYGMVEAANITAGGSIIISEGISGQGTGHLTAGGAIRIGYINQANVFAGSDLYVENSILHSECTANGHVFCQQGNIIGGTLSAGKVIEAKDIGTRLNTNTEIILGVNKAKIEQEQLLMDKKQELESLLEKLKLLGRKLSEQDSSNSKIRVSLLRQRNSYKKTIEQLQEVNEELSTLHASLGDITQAKLIVRNFIYQNVKVTFGKYTRIMKNDHHYVQLSLERKEIGLHQLYS